MRYTELGKTGLRVSVVGLGGIPVQRSDAENAVRLIDACVEESINFIDSARGYTVSEEYLGAALEGRRDKFVLATKTMARDYEGMKRDIDISLKNLRTDYIELYQMHNVKDHEFEKVFGPGGAYEALLEAKAAGKIGHIGISVHKEDGFRRILEEYGDKVESVMFPFNIVETQGLELMKKCTEMGIAFIAMKPMAGGNLTDGSLAMKFILNNPDCTIAIPGMADVEEVRQNAAAAEAGPLTEEEQTQCAKLVQELGSSFCRRCGYCAPCPQGIDIPSNFVFANYLRNYGLGEWAKGRYHAMAHNADDCVKCGACESRCPYELPIRDMLAKVSEDMK